MALPKKVKIVEVSPRDGLQNEKTIVPTDIKIEFINLLSETGLTVIEATSFVSPKWIPQLADGAEVFKQINHKAGISYPVLVPNKRGLENAIASGVKEVAVFCSPSEKFSLKNTNCTVAESIVRIEEVIVLAKQHQLKVRAYLSCVLDCPFEGEMDPLKVADLGKMLHDLGCYELSLGDTIGKGTPLKTQRLIDVIAKVVPVTKLAVHFHDTYGQALANILIALQNGIAVIDSSVGGIGGCPYAKGATGNVATEDVLYMLHGMNINTGVNLTKVLAAGKFIAEKIGSHLQSKVSRALS